jgi:hypothetical protein
MLEKHVEKTLCSPGMAASLVFATTMLGVIVFQQLTDSFLGGSAPFPAHLAIILLVAAMASLLAYVISRAVNQGYSGQDIEDEKQILYGAVMSASMHYLGNSIASFQLIELEVESCGTVSKETLTKISTMLSTTKYNLKCMSAMQNPSAEKIDEYIRNDLSIG